jgi:dUTP pyrophosphatase
MSVLYIKPSEDTQHYYVNHTAAYSGDSGIDLFFPKTVDIPGRSTVIIDLEITCSMDDEMGVPTSYYVYPRSSISKTPRMMANSVGIIDSCYRNTIKVAVYNTSSLVYTVYTGSRLFQICEPGLKPLEVKIVDVMSKTNRGTGFGSSGI